VLRPASCFAFCNRRPQEAYAPARLIPFPLDHEIIIDSVSASDTRRGLISSGSSPLTTNPYESPETKTVSTQPPLDWFAATLRLVALLGLLGLLLLMVMPRWPIGSREAARRIACASNLKNIALALQNYESDYHCLPPAYTVDTEGKPLHSWRTLILPYIDQKELYKKIDLSKPWDHPANKIAFDTPLRLYVCPSSSVDRGLTTYFAVVASNGCFQPAKSTPLAATIDRQNLTMMVIEVSEKHAVHWMSPNDATEEMILSRKTDGEFSHPHGSQAAFVDGHITFLTENVRPDVLRALISIDGNDDDIASDHP